MGFRLGIVFILPLAVTTVTAQETIHSASVSGRVIDPSGAAVQDALVTARHTDTNLTRTANTDQGGRFRVS
jgi:hypothetical protein